MQNHGGCMRNHGPENALCFCPEMPEIPEKYLLLSENPHLVWMESPGFTWKSLRVRHAQTAQEPRIIHLF